MTADDFKAFFPEFSASSYDARIAALLGAVPQIDEDRAGNQLNLALGYWIADKLAVQDIAIKYGVAATSAASSSSTEEQVGKLSTKASFSHSQSASGATAGKTTYLLRYEDLIHQFGAGAVAV